MLENKQAADTWRLAELPGHCFMVPPSSWPRSEPTRGIFCETLVWAHSSAGRSQGQRVPVARFSVGLPWNAEPWWALGMQGGEDRPLLSVCLLPQGTLGWLDRSTAIIVSWKKKNLKKLKKTSKKPNQPRINKQTTTKQKPKTNQKRATKKNQSTKNPQNPQNSPNRWTKPNNHQKKTTKKTTANNFWMWNSSMSEPVSWERLSCRLLLLSRTVFLWTDIWRVRAGYLPPSNTVWGYLCQVPLILGWDGEGHITYVHGSCQN